MSSLQERISARRAQREQELSFVVPVSGYEDVGLAARYKVLRYEQYREIGLGIESIETVPERELMEYADTIIRACVELLERQEDGGYRSLGCKWTAKGVAEHLGVDLPDGATARDAVFAVFNGPMGGNDLFLHFRAYMAEADRVGAVLAEEESGESEPSVEG